MSLRPPVRYATSSSPGARNDAGSLNPLDHEIAGEKAAALGRAGELVENRLRRLESVAADSPSRPALVKEAASAVYAYFIQREICGLRRHQDVVREYRIPREVLARLGAS